jgi:hypothetical protein
MAKGGGDAPSPDPQIGAAALKQATTGEQWLSFARDAFKVSTDRQKGLDALTKRVTEQQLGIGDMSLANAKKDRARYESKGWGAQDAFAKDALSYSSPERQAQAAAEARTGVQTEAAAARAQAQRESAALGVKPGSGRYKGIERAGELATATATAGAGNAARTAMRDKGLALKADVANMYAGLPAQAAQGVSQALGAGSSAVGMNQANQQISNSNSAIMGQGFGGAMQGYAGQASTLLNQYGLQLDAWGKEQELKSANAQGLWSAIGTIGGAAIGLSDRKAKKNIKKVKTGDGLKAVKKMPVSTYRYKDNRPGADGGAKQHIGTMADRYAKATGQKDTGTIDLQDAIGITMKAVQDLDHKVSKMDKALGGKKGPAKVKAKKPTPAPRRSSQSPAKARSSAVKLTTARPGVKAQAFGIRRA